MFFFCASQISIIQKYKGWTVKKNVKILLQSPIQSTRGWSVCCVCISVCSVPDVVWGSACWVFERQLSRGPLEL